MKHNGECRVGVGNVCLSITSDDINFINYFRQYYQRSLTHRSPDFSVRIKVQHNITRSDIPGSLDDYRKQERYIAKGKFSLHDDLLSGIIDQENKTCDLKVEIALIASEFLPLFQDFLFRDLFYYVAGNNHPSSRNRAFLVHACGILREGHGFLFTGPSGSGKSTVARLSKNHTVLHDEAILLSQQEDHYSLEGTPYLSEIGNLKNEPARFKAGFFLKHGPINKIEALPKSKMVTQFIQQIVPKPGFHSMPSRGPLDDMLSFTCNIIESIPFFELYFSPEDDSFWEVIQNSLK